MCVRLGKLVSVNIVEQDNSVGLANHLLIKHTPNASFRPLGGNERWIKAAIMLRGAVEI
jgi:hypothetical protein